MDDYRFMVILRWSDLESLKVKDEPLKNHFHKLRKRHKWDTCAVYEPDIGTSERTCGKGPEMFLRFRQRKENPTKGHHRHASDENDVRLRYPFSPVGHFVEDAFILPDESDDSSENRGEDIAVVPEVGVGEFVEPSDSFLSQHYREPTVSRRVKRATKNNEFIRNKLHELGRAKKLLLGKFASVPPSEREQVSRSLEGLLAGMDKLRNERSDVRPDPEAYSGGSRVPPPPESHCIRHLWCDVCGKCVSCPNSLSCIACYGLYHVLQSDPSVRRRHVSSRAGPVRDQPNRVHVRLSRLDGSESYVCRGCHFPVPQGGMCHQSCCAMNGVPVAFPSRIIGARGSRVVWNLPRDYTAELPGY